MNAETEPKPANILSFDVEEYFHVEASAEFVPPSQWNSYQCRLEGVVQQILDLLAEHQAKATFFVLGWVAQHEPYLVRQIAAAGHEIASHGMNHQMLHRLTDSQLQVDLRTSKVLLEDVTGQAVTGYRAPTFSLTRQTAWAIDVLAEAGYTYDSSVFPVRHDRYGVPDAPRHMHRAMGPGGNTILEMPPLTLRVLGNNVPAGGGGYLRLLPVHMIGHAIRREQKARRATMLYLHPWEFDAGQPVLPMSRLSRYRHRINLSRTALKLHWLLDRFQFTTASSCLASHAASDWPQFGYSQ